ncbi:hypothetical protein HOY82DRAFT_542680 [Tuber indicum]|nr:hypothetical protein HOY82DRAFT_542680 [Tuber indicum]
MDRRWGVLRLVGGVENSESAAFVHSRGEKEEEESAAQVIDTATDTSTTPFARRKRGLRWIITLTSFPRIPIPWGIRYFYPPRFFRLLVTDRFLSRPNHFSPFQPSILGTAPRVTVIPRNHRNNNHGLLLLLTTSPIPPSTPFIAPFLTLLIMAVSLYPLSPGELLYAGRRRTDGLSQWMFIGDDQVMLEPPGDSGVDISGFRGHGDGDDNGRWAGSSGEIWESLELGEWDSGGKIME